MSNSNGKFIILFRVTSRQKWMRYYRKRTYNNIDKCVRDKKELETLHKNLRFTIGRCEKSLKIHNAEIKHSKVSVSAECNSKASMICLALDDWLADNASLVSTGIYLVNYDKVNSLSEYISQRLRSGV